MDDRNPHVGERRSYVLISPLPFRLIHLLGSLVNFCFLCSTKIIRHSLSSLDVRKPRIPDDFLFKVFDVWFWSVPPFPPSFLSLSPFPYPPCLINHATDSLIFTPNDLPGLNNYGPVYQASAFLKMFRNHSLQPTVIVFRSLSTSKRASMWILAVMLLAIASNFRLIAANNYGQINLFLFDTHELFDWWSSPHPASLHPLHHKHQVSSVSERFPPESIKLCESLRCFRRYIVECRF